ncbi:MAG: ferritin family protein [Deltaproteobacteria bacterium]|nr:ferritin family protein [Deltaproteobacteria bacterium]NNG47877.1 ferritin family protein [Deltaproteobacteria bacterium]
MAKTGPTGRKRSTASALERALRFETDGMRFFTAAAAKSMDPFAKNVFSLLAKMEMKHMEDIQAIARKLEEEGKFPKVPSAPHDTRMRLFRREHSRIRREKVISGEAVDGMRKALAFEAEGREMYLRMSKAATNPQEKKFFKLLAGEEDSHFNIIYEYLDFLENQGLRMQDG